MSYTPSPEKLEELRNIALDLANEAIESIEYSTIYESDDLLHLTEAEQYHLYELVTSATITTLKWSE